MLHIVREAGHRSGGSEQECGDAGPVAGVAIAVVDEIAKNRSEKREENGADEDGGNPECRRREKCGVDDQGDGEDCCGHGEGEVAREVSIFVGTAEGSVDVIGKRVEVVASERHDGIGVEGKIGGQKFVGDAEGVDRLGTEEHDGKDF